MKRLFLLLILLFLSGCVYLEEPTQQNQTINKTTNLQIPETNKEIIEDLHWTHLPITFYISNEEECGEYETRRIIRAFSEVSEATNGEVQFKKIEIPADIDISCTFLENCYEKKVDIRKEEQVIYKYETICAHAKGLARISAYRGNEILKAEIVMVGLAGFQETDNEGPSGFYVGSCGQINTEIHEILHTFNFGHINDSKSIMYPSEESIGFTMQEEGSCIGSKKTIDKQIAENLIRIYSKIT